MLSYFSKSAQLLSVKVRIETQVCFDYKLFHGLHPTSLVNFNVLKVKDSKHRYLWNACQHL